MSPFIKFKDKRKVERVRTDTMMKYLQMETDHYFGGDIRNLSHHGLCFETGYFIEPGSVIKIKIEDEEERPPLSDRIHDCRAKVKWCKNPPGYTAFYYRVGVEFL